MTATTTAPGGALALPTPPVKQLLRAPVSAHGAIDFWQRFSADPTARRSFWMLLVIVAACLLLPLVWPWDAMRIDRASSGAEAPSLSHPLGTDQLGRDQLARLLAAGRVSLTIGVVVAVASAVLGSLVGIVAGYVGGRIDEVLMLFVDVLLTVPPLPLLIAVSGMLASSQPGDGQLLDGVPEVWRIILIMSLLGWMTIARVVRTEVLRIRNQPYIEAAQVAGAGRWRVMWRHVLPNVVRPLTVFCAMSVSAAIMGESGLSFLGMGVSPPDPTWGNMIAGAGSVFMFTHHWWLVWTPAIAIVATIMALNFITERLERTLVAQ